MKGSLSTTIAPTLNSKLEQNILSIKKLPEGFQDNSGCTVPERPANIIAYQNKNSIIFLYTDRKSKPVKLDISSGKHSVLVQSNTSPLIKRGQLAT